MVTKAEEDIYWRNDWMQRVSPYKDNDIKGRWVEAGSYLLQ